VAEALAQVHLIPVLAYVGLDLETDEGTRL
jgi:hypothetical protein